MRRSALLLALVLALLLVGISLACAAPNAERRIALVIGNAAYPSAPLKNPVNDARDMAAALRSLGFEVIARENASLAQMEGAVNEFWSKLKKGGAGLFYFAGHGLQVNGRNYLVPVDARLEAEQDAKYKCMDAGLVLGRMENAGNELNIIILDACRNNPFARGWRSADVGLAKMDAPKGSIIAYATAPDSVAADGTGKNGLYTEKLLRAMRAQGQPVEQMFKRVRDEVMRATKDKQVPWESTSLRGDFYFSPGAGAPTPVTASPSPALAAPAPAPHETPKADLPPLSDLKMRLAGKYAEAGDDTGKNGLIFDFALKAGDLIGTPSGWTGGVSPVGISDVRVGENALAFRFTYKKGLLGMAGTTYTDYTCDLSGGLDVIPMTYLTESGNTGKARLIRLQGAGPRPMQQALAASPKQAPPAPAGEHKAGDTWQDPTTGMEFVWVPSGCFKMGSPVYEDWREKNEGPEHEVCVSGLWLGKYAVTNAEFRKLKSSHNSGELTRYTLFLGTESLNGDRQPAVQVSWEHAQAYAQWLSSKGNGTFRLPTEAEWEYAARAGTTTLNYWGDKASDACAYENVVDRTYKQSNYTIDTKVYHDCSDGYDVTAPVGKYKPNPFGLYDMQGNVCQWCEDVYDEKAYASHQRDNPFVSGGGSSRVYRGASWADNPRTVRAAKRSSASPESKEGWLGFRLVRVP